MFKKGVVPSQGDVYKRQHTLAVDNLSLVIVHLVILEKIFTNTKVVGLDFLLRLLDSRCEHLMLDLLALRDSERTERCV